MADLLIAPTALAGVVLTDTEMRSGCALIDFGAATTTVSIYKNNILRYLSVIPLGSGSITRDLTTLQMEESEAESLKLCYGDMGYEEENSDIPATARTEDGRAIPLTIINEIVTARAEEILANAWNQVQQSEYADRLLGGVVLTGGGVNLKHMEEALRKRSKLSKIRIARFVQPAVLGMEDEIRKDGTFGTLIGLLAAGRENCREADEVRVAAEKDMENDLLHPADEIGHTPAVEQTASQDGFFGNDPAWKEAEEKAQQAKNEAKAAGKNKAPKAPKPSWFSGVKKAAEHFAANIFSEEDPGYTPTPRDDEDERKQ
jgi:cell division protein FtsA